MRYIKFIYIFIIFIMCVFVIRCFDKNIKEDLEKLNLQLENDVIFEGYVIDLKESNNHSFGIITLKLIKQNVDYYNKNLDRGAFPYKIRGEIAELYTAIPDGIEKGDYYSVDSNNKIYIYKQELNNKEYKSKLYIILNGSDMKFIEKYSVIK